MNKSHHTDVIEQVPLDYYQNGVRNNIFQRAWHTRKLNAILSYVPNYPVSILDVGCASGWFLSEVHKKFPKAKCVGIDIYKEAISYGKKRYPTISFKVSDAHSISYKSNSFDLVICTEVLEHVSNPLGTLTEIKRVLSKNGHAVIELDSGSMLFSIAWFMWGLGRGRVWHHAHLHAFTVKKLERLLKNTGLIVEKKKKFNMGMAMVFLVSKE